MTNKLTRATKQGKDDQRLQRLTDNVSITMPRVCASQLTTRYLEILADLCRVGVVVVTSHSHHFSPEQATRLKFKPAGLIHLYGRRNYAGVVRFLSVNYLLTSL